MRKLLLVGLIALLVTGCSCRTKRIGQDENADNVPIASAGSELKDVNFGFDKYNIDSTAAAILKDNADWLRKNGSAKVQIEGHCDERGTNEYNMALGANRARSTMEYLRSVGIDASRMSTVSYGEELPLDPRHNEEAWAKNRRAHFNIVSR